jgi:N-acetylmuramoyl-L-alanine amidase
MKLFMSRATAIAVALAALPMAAEAQSVKDRYEALQAREAEVAAAVDAAAADLPTSERDDLLRRARGVIASYDDFVRTNRRSGYADNALFNAGTLAQALADKFTRTADRTAAERYFARLRAEYPSSSLLKSAGLKASATTLSASKASVAESGTRLAASRSATLTSIDRTVMPEVIRITLAFDREVLYHEERLAGPERVFFDLKGVRAAPQLKDGVLRYPDDAVRQIRVGRHPDATVRVVLDLEGVTKYSVFTMYNPFRVVVDCETPTRTAAAAPQPAWVPAPPAPIAAVSIAPVTPTTPVARERRPPAVTVPELRSRRKPPLVPVARVAPEHRTPRLGEPEPRSGQAPQFAQPDTRSGQSIAVAPEDGTEPIAPSAPIAPVAGRGPRLDDPEPRSPQRVRVPEPEEPVLTVELPPPAPPAPPLEPKSNAAGGLSLSRQLGLGVARVVIDPGHGGHDPGAQGKNLNEAALTLDVALRLEKLLQQDAFNVVLTRRTDVYVPLEERTAMANRENADLFLSIHVNASRNEAARGVETYFLSFASSPEAEAVAARENSASSGGMHSLPDIIKAIALNNKLDESRDLAGMVQEALVSRLRRSNRDIRNLGVKKAPFVVLIGASMPSVLAEISFLTNKEELQLLKTSAYKQRVAEALHAAVMRYRRSLKGQGHIAEQ